MPLNQYSLFGKIWWKDYTDQSILALLKILNKRQQGSTDIVFLQKIAQKIIIWLKAQGLLRKFWTEKNTVQHIPSF